MGDMDGHTMVAITGMLRGLRMPNPHPMLMPRPNHGTDGDMDGHTMVVMAMPMERGLLMLNPLPMLTLRLNHGTDGDMDGHTMVVMATPMERGLLTPNPHPMQMLRLNRGTMVDMDGHTMVAIMDTERGLLMLNLPLMLMPSPNRGITAAMDMDGPTMVTTGVELIGSKH